MAKKFKPLEQITKDKSVIRGSLILIKETRNEFEDNIFSKNCSMVKPVFYGGKDSRGIRVFHYIDDEGKLQIDPSQEIQNSIFADPLKGYLLPLNYNSKFEYKLVKKRVY